MGSLSEGVLGKCLLCAFNSPVHADEITPRYIFLGGGVSYFRAKAASGSDVELFTEQLLFWKHNGKTAPVLTMKARGGVEV